MLQSDSIPPKLRVVALVGDRYLAGRIAYRALLSSPDIELCHLILPSEERWQRFEKVLMGPEHGGPEPPWYVRYGNALTAVPVTELLRSGVRELVGRQRATRQLPTGSLTPAPPIAPTLVADANDKTLLARIARDRADIVFVASFPQILHATWWEVASRGAVNLHTSPLPRLRGSQPIWWAIRDGDTEMGATIHRIDSDLDSGDILVQSTHPLDPTASARDIVDWLSTALEPLIHDGLRRLRLGQDTWTPQDPARATSRRWPRAIHRRIQWQTDDSARIVRKVRAGDLPYPVRAFFFIGSRPIEVGTATHCRKEEYLTNDVEAAPGTVLAVSADHLDIATIDGVIRVADLSLHGWKVRCHHLAMIGQRVD
jgi:methionyl-tRNA formyltransferase